VLFGTNPIVVAKVRDLRIAGRLTEPGASAFEGVSDVLEEEKTQDIMLLPSAGRPNRASCHTADLPNIRQRDALHLRTARPGAHGPPGEGSWGHRRGDDGRVFGGKVRSRPPSCWLSFSISTEGLMSHGTRHRCSRLRYPSRRSFA